MAIAGDCVACHTAPSGKPFAGGLSLATQFGSDELKMPISQLTMLILMVQFVAMGGALAFDWLAARISAKKAIAVSLVIWVFVPAYIYAFVHTGGQFFVMGALVALVMGGTSGIGREIALGFAEHGARVLPVSRTREESFFQL